MTAIRAYKNRAHPLWLAYILHRLSGLGLVIFLPLHFWVLSLAMTDVAALDRFLAITKLDAVKLAEFGLVFLLAVHMFGGLRLLALELLPWSGRQKTLAAGVVAVSLFIALMFFLGAMG
jgi:fumarate reductase subunit D